MILGDPLVGESDIYFILLNIFSSKVNLGSSEKVA